MTSVFSIATRVAAHQARNLVKLASGRPLVTSGLGSMTLEQDDADLASELLEGLLASKKYFGNFQWKRLFTACSRLSNQLQETVHVGKVFYYMFGTALQQVLPANSHEVKLQVGCYLKIPRSIANESNWSRGGQTILKASTFN